MKFWNEIDTNIVQDSESTFKRLWADTELRKAVPKTLSSQYKTYKEQIKSYQERTKTLKNSGSPTALNDINIIKQKKNELKQQFVSMVVRYIIELKYNIKIVTPNRYMDIKVEKEQKETLFAQFNPY